MGGTPPMRRAPAAGALRGFGPIIDAGVRVLILGSFPSAASLAAGQYYAHPRNLFWPILGAALGEPLAELPYADRPARVLAHGVGIWDVLAACTRAGSLDVAIRQPRANDFDSVRRRAPQLHAVLFNGAMAGRYAPQWAATGLVVRVLPSTSPAHASLSPARKRAQWLRTLRPLLVHPAR